MEVTGGDGGEGRGGRGGLGRGSGDTRSWEESESTSCSALHWWPLKEGDCVGRLEDGGRFVIEEEEEVEEEEEEEVEVVDDVVEEEDVVEMEGGDGNIGWL